MKTTTSFGFALIATLAIAGCGQPDYETRNADTVSSTESGTSSPVMQAVDDAAITAKVKAELMAESDLTGSKISVETEDGQVVLTGRVPSIQVVRAEEVARQVDGVRVVINRLEPEASS